ncbi:class F sortase [Pseudonocardia sp. GCM10023141]|uniref:class F sortase n=1 Tax=Pseudonocardia sp. GCM10023141 TaxID=3252653 RepID=UPI00361AC542
MDETLGSRRTGRLIAAAAVVLSLVGGGAVAVGMAGEPPAVTRVEGTPVVPAAAPGASTPAATLGPSVPVRLDIPAIGVHAGLMRLGLNADDTVAVPPVDSPDAGWYENSPTPGELGPSVLLGHVDSARAGPGVFFDLRAMRPGDEVSVTRADGSVATFRVDRVVEYAKAAFPASEVYGDIDHAGLRLVTCGGAFDAAAHSYVDNVVVYASAITSGQVR